MKLVIAATGASGSIYLQRLLEQIDSAAHEIHLVLSGHAKQVAKQELGAFKIPKSIAQHGENDLNVPFVEMPISLIPGIDGNCWRNPSTSRRVSGSPPVIRTFDTPSPAAIRIRRNVSS